MALGHSKTISLSVKGLSYSELQMALTAISDCFNVYSVKVRYRNKLLFSIRDTLDFPQNTSGVSHSPFGGGPS